MSDGLAHCRSIRVVKIFEMIKHLSNVIFDIVIALRICIHNWTHARAMDTAKIPFWHLQTFPYCEKSETPQKCSYCTCRINFYCVWQKYFLRAFAKVSLTFYSSIRQSYDTGCASSSDAQFYQTLLYILYMVYKKKLCTM